MAIVGSNIKNKYPTIGDITNLQEYDNHIYSEEEIKRFDIKDAINNHPLAKKPTSMRSKFAYKEIMKNLEPTTKYCLPGQIINFGYAHPKYEEDLEYYDSTPLVLFFGLTRTKDNVIREVGLNLHYFPPFTRLRVLETALRIFRPYFEQQFNESIHKPNRVISWDRLQYVIKQNMKIAFAIKMYVPSLRGNTYVIPTRLLPTAFFEEGHFSKATMQQIHKFWRQFGRFGS